MTNRKQNPKPVAQTQSKDSGHTTQAGETSHALTRYAEVLQRALQELHENSYRDKDGNLCVGIVHAEVQDILKVRGADGNDLIIHPLMYLGYLDYKRSYFHDFDEQYIEEFALKEPEGLENWDTDRIINNLFLALRAPDPGSRILP